MSIYLLLKAVGWVVAGALCIPFAVLLVELLASLLGPRKGTAGPVSDRPGCVVLIPAHNEESSLGATLAHLIPQLRPSDRIVVVADNCADRTADVAKAAGVRVLERHDLVRRGKGFALDHGIRFLASDPPAVVVILDADCTLQGEGLDYLVRQALHLGQPVQALNVIQLPPEPTLKDRLSRFAFLYKNLVRPRGLAALGLPCLLTGTGVAFPWSVIATAPLASGNLVEDMQLGIDLALAGHFPVLCEQLWVSSELASGRQAATQRTRWEQGHLRTLLTQAPRLLAGALLQRRIGLLALALELSVPPLSLLFLAWAAALAGTGLLWLFGGIPGPAVLLLSGGLLTIGSIVVAWWCYGRTDLPLATLLLAAPLYALSKIPIYVGLLFRPERAWVCTQRKTVPQQLDRPTANESLR